MDLSLVIIAVCAVVAVALVIVFIVFGRSEANFTMDIGGAAPRASGGSDSSTEKTLSGRLVGLAVVVGGVFTGLLARLWSMQLVSTDEYAEQAEQNRTSTVYTQAPRGRILDRNGREIVTNRPSLTVVADPEVINDDIEIQLLANLIGMPAQAVRRKIQDATEGQQSLRTVTVDASRRVVAYIGEHPEAFPGVSIEERSVRSYPHGSLAAHVVGYTGTVTQDQLEASKDSESGITYHSGDTVGQAGVELQYESVLQGVRGEQDVFVDADGKVLGLSTSVERQSGSDLVLTLDLDIQQAAEESLERVMEELRDTGYAATGGCVVAVDCTNGEILALASAPTFSPNLFTGGIADADWQALQDEDAHYPMMNRVISGQYPSGSVIKPLTSFAALDYGIAQTDSLWYCSGWWTWDGNPDSLPVMKCWWETGHGVMSLPDGITFSCDVVFYEIGKGFYNADSEGMQETFRRYGLGEKTGVDLPAEAAGRVPDAKWKWDYFKELGYSDEDATWKGGDNANISIGQGDMLVTAMQMVTAYCSIANGGPAWRPHVMKGVRSKIGEGFVTEYQCEVIRDVEEDEAYREVIAQGMEGVIYREDESQASHWTNLDVTVRGKTGTAEQPGGDPIGWFIAYAPAENPKYVVGGNMDRVLQGASSAMYVVRDVFGAIYGQPDDSSATTTIAD